MCFMSEFYEYLVEMCYNPNMYITYNYLCRTICNTRSQIYNIYIYICALALTHILFKTKSRYRVHKPVESIQNLQNHENLEIP